MKPNGTYHIRVERRCKFLGVQVIPVYWREEHVILDLSLHGKQQLILDTRRPMEKQTNDFRCKHTYKVIRETQSLGTIFLQQTFQQMSSSI